MFAKIVNGKIEGATQFRANDDQIEINYDFAEYAKDGHLYEYSFANNEVTKTLNAFGIAHIESLNRSPLVRLREKRNKMLQDSDWTQLLDAPLSESERQKWRIYRQELRDLPSKYPILGSINDVVFPTLSNEV